MSAFSSSIAEWKFLQAFHWSWLQTLSPCSGFKSGLDTDHSSYYTRFLPKNWWATAEHSQRCTQDPSLFGLPTSILWQVLARCHPVFSKVAENIDMTPSDSFGVLTKRPCCSLDEESSAELSFQLWGLLLTVFFFLGGVSDPHCFPASFDNDEQLLL